MEGPPLGPAGEDITWPDQVAPRGQKASSTRKVKPQTSKHTHPDTPARSGGAQPKPEPKPTHPQRAPQSGVAAYKQSAHTNTGKPHHPSHEWRGAAETRAGAHTPSPHNPARSGRVQVERAHKHTHPNTPARRGGAQPKPEPKHAHPSQEWRGTSGGRTQKHTPQHSSRKRRGPAKTRAQAHTPTPHTPARSGRGQRSAHRYTHAHPNTPARSCGAQPKPEPKQTHPHRTPQPGVAGYKRSPHTSTNTPKHPSQGWRGAAKTRAQAYTHTPPSRATSGGAQPKPEPKHTHTHSPAQPGVAGCSPNPSQSTQAHTAHTSQEWRGTSGARTQTNTPQHPSQEWRGAAKTRAQAQTPKLHTPARSGGVQAERAHRHTHNLKPQPGVAGRSRNPSTST